MRTEEIRDKASRIANVEEKPWGPKGSTTRDGQLATLIKQLANNLLKLERYLNDNSR
jgi:hypothetical protein